MSATIGGIGALNGDEQAPLIGAPSSGALTGELLVQPEPELEPEPEGQQAGHTHGSLLHEEVALCMWGEPTVGGETVGQVAEGCEATARLLKQQWQQQQQQQHPVTVGDSGRAAGWWLTDGTKGAQIPYTADFSAKLTEAFLQVDESGRFCKRRWVRSDITQDDAVVSQCGNFRVMNRATILEGEDGWCQLPATTKGDVQWRESEPARTVDLVAYNAVVSGNLELLKLTLPTPYRNDDMSGPLDRKAPLCASLEFRGPSYARNGLLHTAVLSGSMGCVRLLLARGANPQQMNVHRETPLKLLRQAEAHAEVPTSGRRPDQGGRIDVLKELIDEAAEAST
jgi:hypothetical protein